MDDTSWGYYGGTNGVPSNDSDPYLGAIDTVAQLDEDANNGTVLDNPIQPSSGSTLYYGGGYRKLLTAATTANNCRVYNRAGAILNTLAGVPSVVSLSAIDTGVSGNAARTGLQVRLVAKVSGVWVEQYINPLGTVPSSDVAGGALTVDASSAYRWEASFDGFPTLFSGDVGCFVGTQLVAVIRGTLNPRRGIPGKGNQMASAEVQVAVATAKNATVTGASGRLAPPAAGIGSFDSAVLFGGTPAWVGSDQSLVLPGDPYVTNDYFAYVVQFEALAGIFSPLGNFQADVGVVCNA